MNIVKDSDFYKENDFSQLDKKLIKEKRILLIEDNLDSVLIALLLKIGFEKITFLFLKKEAELKKETSCILDIEVAVITSIYEIEKKNALLFDEKTLAINNLDYATKDYFLFDDLCKAKNALVLHFFSIQKLSVVILASPKGLPLITIKKKEEFNQLMLLNYVIGYMKFWGVSAPELELLLSNLKTKKREVLSSKLKKFSSSISILLSYVLVEIVLKNEIKEFPEFYVSFKE